MNNVYSEFKRGDVWYVKLKTEFGDNNDKSSVQKKSRPYLIVSCEKNNNCAPILNVVPISTQMSDHLPMHVYYNANGRHQLIMCEQITTLSVLDFHRDGSHFMYSFNLDFMNKVDEALTAQLGLRPRIADMQVLERLIEKISADKDAELKRKYESNLEARVEAIAAKLAKTFGVDLTAQDMLNGLTYRPEEVHFASKETQAELNATAKQRMTPPAKTAPVKSEPKPETAVSTAASQPPVEPAETKKSKKSGRTNNKWDEASMKQFLSDYNHLSVSAMAAKWSMAKKSVATYASLFRKRLESSKD